MLNHDSIDFFERGSGARVILLHSSVAGARQWRNLIDSYANHFHFIAINLFGYGKTPAWPATKEQSLADQARLVYPFLPEGPETATLIGHSFGGTVAMKAAALFPEKTSRLILIEPNPFDLLLQHNCAQAVSDIMHLRQAVKTAGATNQWRAAAKTFADFWTGTGSWKTMPEDRKAKFCAALPPNFHEWDAVMNEKTTLNEWGKALPKNTTIISAADTVRAIRKICSLMQQSLPHWHYKQVSEGGHMAPLTRPDLINPVILQSLKS